MTESHYQKYKTYQTHYNKVFAERKRKNQIAYHHRQRKKVLDLLGNKCKRCGFSDKRALQIDHINGGGLKETKSFTKMYTKYIVEELLCGSKKYQLLCANCNWIKRAENKETTTRRVYN